MTQYNNELWNNFKFIIKQRKKMLVKLRNKRNFIMSIYKDQMGYEFDLDNPKTFNEYINWFKYNYRFDKKNNYSDLADKYNVRKYVAKKIGEKYLIPQFFRKRKLKVSDLEKLPNQFVLKTNNASSTNYIVFDKTKEDLKHLCDYMNDLLKIKYYLVWGEFHYKGIKPYIVAESLLKDKHGNIPDDLKCFCFKDSNGKRRKILYLERVIGDERFRINFDENWKRINVKSNFQPLNINLKKPKNYKEILHIIDKLSEDFNFVRVDLFLLDDKIYFGELTFTPSAGYLKFEDDSDKIWGSWIDC
jgi:hypothetical protein